MQLVCSYVALFSTLKQIHCTFVACDFEWVTVAFYDAVWTSTQVVYLQCCLVVTRKCCCLGAHFVYTTQPCTMLHHFMQSHMLRVQLCFVIPCHLHFWQHDWDFLRATVVTQGWNRYWNKSQHWKLTLEKKILLLQQGFKPPTFQSWVQCSNHWAIPTRSEWMEGWIDWLIFFTTILMIWWMD